MTASHESLVAVAREHAAAEGRGDVETVLRTLEDDPVYELQPVGLEFRGMDAVRAYYDYFFSTFSTFVAGATCGVNRWRPTASCRSTPSGRRRGRETHWSATRWSASSPLVTTGCRASGSTEASGCCASCSDRCTTSAHRLKWGNRHERRGRRARRARIRSRTRRVREQLRGARRGGGELRVLRRRCEGRRHLGWRPRRHRCAVRRRHAADRVLVDQGRDRGVCPPARATRAPRHRRAGRRLLARVRPGGQGAHPGALAAQPPGRVADRSTPS